MRAKRARKIRDILLREGLRKDNYNDIKEIGRVYTGSFLNKKVVTRIFCLVQYGTCIEQKVQTVNTSCVVIFDRSSLIKIVNSFV